LEALGLNLGYLFVQIFNFIIVFIVLRAWVYFPIVELLEKRRERIAEGLEDARVAAEARENAEEEARQIMANAQTEASVKIKEASERADTAGKDIIAQAENDADNIRQSARSDAEQERDRLLSEVRGQIAALAMAATQKLVGGALDEKRQHILIDEFFSGVKTGEVVVLEDIVVSDASAEIISAVPLTEEEKETIRQDILAKAGSQTVSFRVDPAILGGLVVKIGDKVLDGSVSGQMENLRQSLA
jgi:F-type H+-transporting ATPase subunit b